MEVRGVRLTAQSQDNKIVICYHESVHDSVIAKVHNNGSHFQSNLYSVRPGSGFCP